MSELTKIRAAVGLFIVGLVLAGVSALPIEWGLGLLADLLEIDPTEPLENLTGLRHWIALTHQGISETYTEYPFIAYGTDWLAFGHFVIAILFIGAFVNPVRNVWLIYAGIIACVAVWPTALIAGPVRQIPFFWQLVDCSFGVAGLFPLAYALVKIRKMEGSTSNLSGSCGS